MKNVHFGIILENVGRELCKTYIWSGLVWSGRTCMIYSAVYHFLASNSVYHVRHWVDRLIDVLIGGWYGITEAGMTAMTITEWYCKSSREQGF